MPKIHRGLLDHAVTSTVGPITYSKDNVKLKQFRALVGMSRGQLKRFVLNVNRARFGCEYLRVPVPVIKKMELVVEHKGNPHLPTLLKIVDAQYDPE